MDGNGGPGAGSPESEAAATAAPATSPPCGTAACSSRRSTTFFKGGRHHGKQVGDRVLSRTEQALAAAMRAGDVLYRVGGDEFAALLSLAHAEQLQAYATGC